MKHTKNRKQSRFVKWLKRAVFLLLLLLFLLHLHHIDVAIEALTRFNMEQSDLIHNLQQDINLLDASNLDVHNQIETLKIKINGLQINQLYNVAPQQEIHTETHETVHKNLPLHINNSIINSSGIITTTVVTLMTVVKGISSLIPILP